MKTTTQKVDLIFADKEKSVLKFEPNPNGKYQIIQFRYSWIERLMIKLKLLADKRYFGSKYMMGIDPI